ncbi:MAG: phosphoribosylanthranilate isomerase [Thermodesulfobacteriota bacterium]|nr:phosphoribosylanthranilate isomerase [Thermodesulfobacteriota bacterium]
MIKVKICGITNQGDAINAVESGADAIGFIFARSPRRVTPKAALEIIKVLPPFTRTVGVFVNEDPATITDIALYCGLDLLQLHGDESPDVCGGFMPRTIKALRLRDESSLQSIEPYRKKVRALLFDTYSQEKRGGTGETFDWDLAVKGREFGPPVILSGGLSPANIEAAITIVRPYAVDVNSGVEERPGKKSPILVKELMKTIRSMSA